MDQHLLKPPVGSKRPRKRVGRGDSSGHGAYSTRGLKGQKARAGGKVRAGFEGGQIPLVRRLGHKRGFKNALRVEFLAVNLRDLARHFSAGATVDAAALLGVGLLDEEAQPFKVLGLGSLPHALTVRAPRLSETAKAAITAAGGTFEELAAAERRVRNRIHRRGQAS
ncbi:MAG: 50S ribosomal protein L15 [Dehalococcoidia bacterium]|nr:50S ribosomal protein L15 [Dehalococcoidia bacterium]